MNPHASNLRRIAEEHLKTTAVLHQYQWEGIAFLYKSISALLADEMGLGKTVQSVIALSLLLNDTRNGINRVLIVVPASLTLNWMSELAKWAPSITARRVQGNTENRIAFYLLPIPVLVSSYEQIRQDGLDKIPADTFDLVILDEAQRIKNKNSTTALACQLLPRKRSWALTATPLENKREDVASILSFLDLKNYREITNERLTLKLEKMMLRRRKREVKSELPPVIVQDIKLELTTQQRIAYDDLWTSRKRGISYEKKITNGTLLGLITKLKIICNYDTESNASSKLDLLLTICDNAEKDARIIVFSQFVKTLHWISANIGIKHDLLTGSMTTEERYVSIERFKNEVTPRALLISLRAGGVGLNLGEATHTIMFDRWWNPAVEQQATYRAHRFDRDGPLHVIRFLVQDTIEERIATIHSRKEVLFEDVIDFVSLNQRRLTKRELMEILELSEGDIMSSDMHEGK